MKKREISDNNKIRDSSQFLSKDLSIYFLIQLEDILCTIQGYIENTWIKDFSHENKLEDYFIVLKSKYREVYP